MTLQTPQTWRKYSYFMTDWLFGFGAEFKSLTGHMWTPGHSLSTPLARWISDWKPKPQFHQSMIISSSCRTDLLPHLLDPQALWWQLPSSAIRPRLKDHCECLWVSVEVPLTCSGTHLRWITPVQWCSVEAWWRQNHHTGPIHSLTPTHFVASRTAEVSDTVVRVTHFLHGTPHN